MRELSVTDVQRVLREHANIGHDVLQHPHHVVVQDKPYRMRVASGLYMSRDPDDDLHFLSSNLMLSERPLLSNILTRLPGKSLEVRGLIPNRDRTSTTTSKDFFGSRTTSNDFFDEGLKPSATLISGMDYRSDGKNPIHAKSAHEALHAHVNLPIEHIGVEDTHSQGLLFHKQMSDFNPPFDLPTALADNAVGWKPKPFSGLIYVLQHPEHYKQGFAAHHYNPETEQLTRVY